MAAELRTASGAAARRGAARRWLTDCASDQPVVVLGAHPGSASELIREHVLADPRGRGALFGWRSATLDRVAAELALPRLARLGLAPVAGLALDAIAARVIHRLAAAGELGRLAPVADRPGLPRAVARTLAQLGEAGVSPEALPAGCDELARIQAVHADELVGLNLVTRPTLFDAATEQLRARSGTTLGSGSRLIGAPLLLLDVAITSPVEAALVAALAAAAPRTLVTVPSGDGRTLDLLQEALGLEAEPVATHRSGRSVRIAPAGDSGGQLSLFPIDAGGASRTESVAEDAAMAAEQGPPALQRLQQLLFGAPTGTGELGDAVSVFSAPGESRECVEIARRLLLEADRGTAFDRMAVVLRAPQAYRVHLVEALRRAAIPAWFARGVVRPDPAGRALLSLLACAAEGLSARAFAEYLSLSVVPEPDEEGAPPEAPPAGDRFVPADNPATELPELDESESTDQATDDAAVVAGTLRAPRRWERLIVDAAVIGGRARWERRLDGMDAGLRLAQRQTEEPDPDDPRLKAIARRLQDLDTLRRFALPLLDLLQALPEAATWGEWLEQLSALATRALRHPQRVLQVLGELEPMEGIAGVTLHDVRVVLRRRLTELVDAPTGSSAGRVFVGDVDDARGRVFDVVFVPGLAEKIFPQKVTEDPVLLDVMRRQTSPYLITNDDRVAAERLALHLAVGAARQRVILSYPRIDTDQARPRVPSFYGLEVLRAAEGSLPGFQELARRADAAGGARMGWPAPSDRRHAIDDAEYDLAVLETLLTTRATARTAEEKAAAKEAAMGAARYLITSNIHLRRALRFRASRWLRRWTQADGLVEPEAHAREVLTRHRIDARPYSPTALQHFAACPYRFFLQAILRLEVREVPEPVEELDPLQRGSLIHEIQFQVLGALRAAGALPVTGVNLDQARAALDEALYDVAGRYREELAPAIDRVWDDGIARIRADLREWLLRQTGPDAWEPAHFELAFGIPRRMEKDPASSDEPVLLDCGLIVRGSVDLVERRGDRLRATDYKTGRALEDRNLIIGGGQTLQPVVYGLALEKLFPQATVESGRLYFCTDRGGFAEHEVLLNQQARDALELVARGVSGALESAFMPAAPNEGACRWCDYRVVCGPYEEQRASIKRRDGLEGVRRIRMQP